MALADPALSASAAAGAAHAIAKSNAELLETIDATTDGTFVMVEAAGKLLMRMNDKLNLMIEDNKKLHEEITSLKEQIKKPTPYVR